MLIVLLVYLINKESIRSLISTNVYWDSAIAIIQDVNYLIDDDPVWNLLEPKSEGTNPV